MQIFRNPGAMAQVNVYDMQIVIVKESIAMSQGPFRIHLQNMTKSEGISEILQYSSKRYATAFPADIFWGRFEVKQNNNGPFLETALLRKKEWKLILGAKFKLFEIILVKLGPQAVRVEGSRKVPER